jgi:hypothetical protein
MSRIMIARESSKPTLENRVTGIIESKVPVFVEIDARGSTFVATVMSSPGDNSIPYEYALCEYAHLARRSN